MENNEEMNLNLEQEAPVVTEQVSAPPAKKSKKKKIVVAVIAVVLCLALVAVGVLLPREKSTVEEVNNLFSDGLLRVYDGKKWGYIDKTGELAIPAKYKSCGNFCEGLAWFSKTDKNKETKYGFINTTGEQVIGCAFDGCGSFSEGLCAVEKDEKWGFINSEGDLVVAPQYEDVYNFCDGLARVETKDKWGYIDKTGKMVIGCIYDYTSDFVNGEAIVGIKNDDDWKYGIINKNGEYIIPAQYYDLSLKTDGLYPCAIADDTCGYLDENGKIAIGTEFHDEFEFKNGLATVEKDGLWGVINKKGEYVVNLQYDNPIVYYENLAAVCVSDRYGYLGTDGNTVINIQYDEAGKFVNGMACVKMGDNYGYIANDGSYVINIQYPFATDFYSDGFAIVANSDKKYQLIDKEGNAVGSSWEQIGYYGTFCSTEGCYGTAMSGQTYCYSHKPQTYSYSRSYCKWSGCYNTAKYSGYCYYHYSVLLDYLY